MNMMEGLFLLFLAAVFGPIIIRLLIDWTGYLVAQQQKKRKESRAA